MFYSWGIPVDPILLMQRTMTTQTLYGAFRGDKRYSERPEAQFVRHLMEKKQRQLKEIAANRKKDAPEVDLVLDVELMGVRPRVWRRVRLASSMPLLSFQDKVLAPLMGWSRNYHGWLIIDDSDLAQYGPGEECNAIDMMHLPMHGFLAMESAEVRLDDALEASKDKRLTYLYDLGDHWNHTITLVEVLPPEKSDGRCRVLDGAIACPPEDSNGCPDKGNRGYDAFLAMKKNTAEYREAVDELLESTNYRSIVKRRYDPFHFSVEECQQRLQEAFASQASAVNGSKLYHMPLQFGKSAVDVAQTAQSLGGHLERGQKTLFEKDRNGPGVMVEAVNTSRDKRNVSLCASCGKPNCKHICSRCRVVRYCSRDCQVAHWGKNHKKECKKAAKKDGPLCA